jgi:hypothetical protein
VEVNIQLYALDALSVRKELQIPIVGRLSGPQSGSGSCGDDKDFFLLPGIKL